MRSLLLSGTALAAVLATGAEAADLPMKAPPLVAPASPWTGFYAGIVGGYGWRDPSIDFSGNAAAQTQFFAAGLLPNSVPVDPKGGLIGIQGGYNYQSGMKLFGVEADIFWADIKGHGSNGTGVPLEDFFLGSKPNPSGVNRYLFQINGEQKISVFGTLRGRLGILPTERWLLFATGGLAFGKVSVSGNVINVSGGQQLDGSTTITPFLPCTNVCAGGTNSEWKFGWTVGLGSEYLLSERWTVKVDALYYDLGSASVAFSDPRFPAYVFNASADFKGYLVRGAISFKFN